MPLVSYEEMQTIFAFGLATGKYAKGSAEPLGTPCLPSKDDDTQDSDSVTVDGTEKAGDKRASKGVDALVLLRGGMAPFMRMSSRLSPYYQRRQGCRPGH